MTLPALYDIDEGYKRILDVLEVNGGDLTAMQDYIEKNEVLHREKIDNYVGVIEKIEADADVCEAMIKRLKARKASMEKNAERLKESLKESMKLRGIQKVEAPLHTIYIQKNSQAAVVIKGTLEEMPTQYKRTIPEHEVIDTEKLRHDALNGVSEAVALCEVGEVGTSLRIR